MVSEIIKVEVVLIFLKHNGLCGWSIGSSQLYSQSRPYTKPESLPYFLGVHKSFILGLTVFLLYIIDLPDDVICNIVSYVDDTTVFSKCDQASALWQQLELDAELEFDL